MEIDFRRDKTVLSAININGETVEMVTTYKYLRIEIDNKLNFRDCATSGKLRKLQQRMYFYANLTILM